MKTKNAKTLPKTGAWSVHVQYIRCGKASCHCSPENGGVLHGPYYYRFDRVNGRLRKRYVRVDAAAEVHDQCEKGRSERQAMRAARVSGVEQLREVRRWLMESFARGQEVTS